MALLILVPSMAFALDVTHYRLEIDLYADDEALGGSATLDVTLDDADLAKGSIALDFVGMEVDGLFVNGLEETGWTREGGVLTIPTPTDGGLSMDVQVDYQGTPEPYVESWGTWGVVHSADRIFTVNVTEGARHWFPCNDRLDDKATTELLISVPDPWLVAAPGALLAQEPDGEGRTRFDWAADWPLPTYLIHFAAGPYILTEEVHQDVPYAFYLHPTLYEDASDTFAHAPAAMEMLIARYGDYPFPKVAFDEIDLGGAVENPSCVSIGTQILVPTQVYEDVVAHEMSHAWFQGVVTIETWDDVWLSEGMATYHEALYHEFVHGPGTLTDYTESLAISYRAVAEMAEGYFPLSKPDTLWGVTTYRKGALVLHTLSHLMGRDAFDQFLVGYLDTFQWGNASTADFRALAEAGSGLDLGPFFDEWVHSPGYPQFGLAWRYDADDGVVEVAVDQRQPEDWPLFLSVPVELEFLGAGTASQRVEMTLTDQLTVAAFPASLAPLTVVLDPDRWLLKTVEDIEFPDVPEPEVGPEPSPTGDVGPEAFSPTEDLGPTNDGMPAVEDGSYAAPPKGGGGCGRAGAPVLPLELLVLGLFLGLLVAASRPLRPSGTSPLEGEDLRRRNSGC